MWHALQYEPDSAPALALNATIDRTETRFATYARQGLLCGADGLPHLISDPGLAIRYGHAGETLVSSTAGVMLDKSHSSCFATFVFHAISLGFNSHTLSATLHAFPVVHHPAGLGLRRSLCLFVIPPLTQPMVYMQIPTVGFLYIAGYIGYVGRDYIRQVKNEKKPTEKEIIIDVPFAIKLAFQGIGWPFRAIQELRAGTLTEDDSNITVSPR